VFGILAAVGAVVMVPSRPHPRHRSPRPGKAPRALGHRTLGTSPFVGPVAFTQHAMVGVWSPDQHLLLPGAEWAELEADIWQVSRLAVVGRNSAGHGGRPGMVPSVTVLAPMRVPLVPVLHPLGSPYRSSVSSFITASLGSLRPGASCPEKAIGVGGVGRRNDQGGPGAQESRRSGQHLVSHSGSSLHRTQRVSPAIPLPWRRRLFRLSSAMFSRLAATSG
jgi:hypothetical protein